MKKIKFCLILSLVLFSSSCEKENPTELPENGLNLELDFSSSDFNMKNQFDLNKVSIEQIIQLTVNELYSVDFEDNLMKNNPNTYALVDGFDINIKDDLVTVSPIVNPVQSGACGSGSGWSKYATCDSESCIRSEMKKTAEKLSEKLTAGKCMDIRVKRNPLSAVVCGRIVDC